MLFSHRHVYKFRQRNLFFSEVSKVDLFDFGTKLFIYLKKCFCYVYDFVFFLCFVGSMYECVCTSLSYIIFHIVYSLYFYEYPLNVCHTLFMIFLDVFIRVVERNKNFLNISLPHVMSDRDDWLNVQHLLLAPTINASVKRNPVPNPSWNLIVFVRNHVSLCM